VGLRQQLFDQLEDLVRLARDLVVRGREGRRQLVDDGEQTTVRAGREPKLAAVDPVAERVVVQRDRDEPALHRIDGHRAGLEVVLRSEPHQLPLLPRQLLRTPARPLRVEPQRLQLADQQPEGAGPEIPDHVGVVGGTEGHGDECSGDLGGRGDQRA